jgi:hypothetical protein
MKIKLFSNSGNFQNNVIMDGFTLMDFLTLYRNPDGPQEAATKRYADSFPSTFNVNQINGSVIPKALLLGGFGGDLAGFNGTDAYLSGVGIQPGSYNRVTVNAKGRIIAATTETYGGSSVLHFGNIIDRPVNASGYVDDVSGYAVRTNGINSNLTLTDNLYTSVTPTTSGHAATRSYLNQKAGAMVPKIRVGDLKISTAAIRGPEYLRANGGVLSKTTYPALYAVLGDTYNNQNSEGYMGQPWRQQYAFNGNVSTSFTFTQGTSLPINLTDSSVVVTTNRIYLMGGRTTTSTWTSAVYTAPINADGTLGSWASATPLPEVLTQANVIITKNRVYIMGAGTGLYSVTSKIYTAPINADGTIGVWSGAGNIPQGLASSSPVVIKNFVYLLGGYNGSTFVGNVYKAPINVDGTLGAWTSSTSLPVGVSNSQAIVTKTRVYLLGGFSGSAPISTVYTAPINADGSLGAWSTGPELPIAAYCTYAFATRNRIYFMGGASYSATITSIYTIPINLDDSLGIWSSMGTLPVALAATQGACVNNKFYLLGGWSGSVYINSTYSTPFNGGTNDYMALISSFVPDETQFKLPDYSSLKNGVMEYFIRAVE